MTRKAFFRKAIRKLPLVVAMSGAALALYSCGEAEAEPKADPAQVQLYLEQIDADERLISGEAKRKEGHEKRIRQLVEGAATRAPSDASINKIETVVAGN
ncbi:MAG: hypothetical protein H0W74_04910 [Sphingosinicella sp.]|nr:hypothetical protein [Sphingosinicella sp.]